MDKKRAYNELIDECESLVDSIYDAYSSIEIDSRGQRINEGAAEDIIDETSSLIADTLGGTTKQRYEFDSLMKRNGTSIEKILADGVARYNQMAKEAEDRFKSFELPDKSEFTRQLMNELVHYIDDVCERDPDRLNAKVATDMMMSDCEPAEVVNNLIAAYTTCGQRSDEQSVYGLEWQLIYGNDTYLSHISGDDVETFKKLIPEDECKSGDFGVFGDPGVGFDECFDHIDDLAHRDEIREELSSIFNRYRRRVYADE